MVFAPLLLYVHGKGGPVGVLRKKMHKKEAVSLWVMLKYRERMPGVT